MTVPTWDQYMAPSLQVLSDGDVHRLRQLVVAEADLLEVGPEERPVKRTVQIDEDLFE